MSFPPLGPPSAAAHHEHCNAGRCCRCQQRPWTTRWGDERLCGLCAACCRECGRAPAPHLDGLDDGLCTDCRGLCGACHHPPPPEGACPCRNWRARAGIDPVGYVLQAFPHQLTQAFGRRLPAELRDLVHQQLGHRTPDQLLDRVERRWNVRWAHALHEKDEDGRRRWTPQEIAEQLIRPGACSHPQCEDGFLLTTDTACTYCRRPTHRFVPSAADRTATTEHARATAADIRRTLLQNRARTRRPGHLADP
ncbi:hypothetical protein [Streptomyces atratus]|uniref:hypothetical protein n=1 Tax=Streptomyces atratus TaxID=1893 RepID=UPI00340A889D